MSSLMMQRVAARASAGITYSTSEVWTGDFWVDPVSGVSKKIYAKLFSGTLTPSRVPDVFAGVTENWEETISVDVSVGKGERSIPYFENSAPNTPNWPYCYFSATLFNNDLTIMHGTSIPITDFVALLKYTKTEG